MPQHNSATATRGKQRSAVTGRQLGKAAVRAENKNAEAVTSFHNHLKHHTNVWQVGPARRDSSEIPLAPACILGRVVRGYGAGRLEVILYDGTVVSTRIAGRIAFHGSAATKTDRASCMCAGDYIIVEGGLAAAKMSVSMARRIAGLYTTANPLLKGPKDFFDEKAEEDQGFDWDRSEEEGAEAEEVDLDNL